MQVYEVVYRCDRGLNGTKRMWRTPRRKLIMAFKLVADLCEGFPTGVSLARRLTTLVKEIVFLDFCVCVCVCILCMCVCVLFPLSHFLSEIIVKKIYYDEERCNSLKNVKIVHIAHLSIF